MEKNKGIFQDFTSEMPKITGSSTINHAVRVKLGMTADEYCFMLYLEDRKQKGRELDLAHCFSIIGYNEEVCKFMYENLIRHGFLHPFSPGEIPDLTKRWYESFDTEFEFNKFWIVSLPEGKTRIAWPGSKTETKRIYNTIRKKYSAEYLLRQRDYYFEFLRKTTQYTNFNRAKMGAPVWLNPTNEKFKTDWKLACDELDEKYNPKKPPVESVSIESVKKAYEK